ncbi:S41 family peptidase [uncultured Lutibacter sp.]|uniref:S41 family peptidase n=1 Tax=uncultured Lutibacter sp. TaxID=437739 RepID=UPI0026296C43|nr:S41 family peptidase [uncultured Lutibacter sp.]
MKKKRLLFTLLYLSFTSVFTQSALAPIIIETIPSIGATNVDTNIKEIIIKFNQDMSPYMSIMSSPNMPKKTGKPRWLDKRTFSIPVELYPNNLYTVVLNSSTFRNFKSAEGVSLHPVSLYFHTKTIDYNKHHKKAFKELSQILPSKYSYASHKNVNWETLLKQNESAFQNAKTTSKFTLLLTNMLKKAEDPHIWVEYEGKRYIPSTAKLGEINYNSKYIVSIIQNKKTSKYGFIAGNIKNVAYISIPNWSNNLDELVYKFQDENNTIELSFEDVLKELFKYENLIIDVRDNRGGNENYAKVFASYFAKDTIPYEKVVSYNKQSKKFDNSHIKKIYPNKKNHNYSGNVYVLSSSAVMSSNESFILMMKTLPNTKVVGMTTYGGSGNPKAYDLSNGIKVYLPSWKAYTLEGDLIEDHGIKPDIEIITTEKEFINRDVLIDRVLKMIKKL